jgi:hypothetical protein
MYESPTELKEEHDTQMVKGGLLVRGEPPPGVALYDRVELEIAGRFPPLDKTSVIVVGQIVQIVAGVGVAVVFDPAPLTQALAATGAPRPVAVATSDKASKIHQALHGNKDDRLHILRDTNKTFQQYVLRNPGLELDEIVAMAKMRTLAPDVLAAIAGRKEWLRADIAIALVRNPSTPTPTAVRMLDHVSPADLRQLAKDTHTRPPVQQAARKKLFGGA